MLQTDLEFFPALRQVTNSHNLNCLRHRNECRLARAKAQAGAKVFRATSIDHKVYGSDDVVYDQF